jgi:hypothetical protein
MIPNQNSVFPSEVAERAFIIMVVTVASLDEFFQSPCYDYSNKRQLFVPTDLPVIDIDVGVPDNLVRKECLIKCFFPSVCCVSAGAVSQCDNYSPLELSFFFSRRICMEVTPSAAPNIAS